MGKLRVTLQRATRAKDLPSDANFTRWVRAALAGRYESCELTIRLVDQPESTALNHRYRHIDAPTNVLSFPASVPAGVTSELLGDLVMCAPLVKCEAAEQGKPPQAHWAHLTVHGTLHLLGYDHETTQEAVKMESLEIDILAGLGYPDPYA